MDNRVLGNAIHAAPRDGGPSITRDAVKAFFRRLQTMARAGVHPNRRPEGEGRCLLDSNSGLKKRMRAASRGIPLEKYRKTSVQMMIDALGLKP